MGFLTLEQRQRYGRYESEPTPMQLARYFHLDDTDFDSVLIRRGNQNRLGFALQLVSVRFLGTFLENPIDVPPGVIIHVATQLGISDIECLPRYLERSVTHWEHQGEIQQRYGYRDFSGQPGHWQLVRWLYGRAWVGSESPSVLFDLITARLVEHKILLPGVTVLERLVASVRERTAKRLWQILSKIPSKEQRSKLEALLVPDEKTWYTPLDQLRRAPTRHSAPALVNALNRLVKVRSLGINTLNFSGIPVSRLKALARHAATIRVQAIARMPFERRIATLLAFIHTLEALAADDTLDVLELLIKDLLSKSVRDGKKEHRLAWIQQNYLRSETLKSANARLVDAQTQIPLAQTWGGGEVASADGLRFVVPVQTLNSGPNSKYFGRGRGITYYNFTSDQFTGFHGLVVPGTLRDSLVVLLGLLEQQTSLRPKEIMTDTSGYSDVIFGLFWLLGYQFSPRLADVGEARFWRLDSQADYGVLNGIARQRVNTSFIENYWDDMLRVAGSLKLGTVSATDIMQTLYRGEKPSVLGRAIGELGRIAKTLYLLNYVDSGGVSSSNFDSAKSG